MNNSPKDLLTKEYLEDQYAQQHKSLREIATNIGCGKETVRAALQRHGILARPAVLPGLTLAISDDEITRRYQAGETTTALAVALGCDVQVVRRRLRMQGFAFTVGRKRRTPEQIAARFNAAAPLKQQDWALAGRIVPIQRVPENTPWWIYLLADPRDGSIKYVGQTNNLDRRYEEHLHGRYEKNAAKTAWITDLTLAGLQPILHVVQEGQGQGAEAAEARWLAHYTNADLLNQRPATTGKKPIRLEPVPETWLAALPADRIAPGDPVLPSNVIQKINATDRCWLWTAATTHGYGVVQHNGKVRRAHRIVYTYLFGPIPEGAVLDHLDGICESRACVRPDHLDPTSNHQNILRGTSQGAINARKTHCKAGHEFTPENTRIVVRKPPRSPERSCITCERERSRKAAYPCQSSTSAGLPIR